MGNNVINFEHFRKDHRLAPPWPDIRMVVVCEGCGKNIHIDDAANVGTELTPVFVCLGEYSCMKKVARYYVAQTLTSPVS